VYDVTEKSNMKTMVLLLHRYFVDYQTLKILHLTLLFSKKPNKILANVLSVLSYLCFHTRFSLSIKNQE